MVVRSTDSEDVQYSGQHRHLRGFDVNATGHHHGQRRNGQMRKVACVNRTNGSERVNLPTMLFPSISSFYVIWNGISNRDENMNATRQRIEYVRLDLVLTDNYCRPGFKTTTTVIRVVQSVSKEDYVLVMGHGSFIPSNIWICLMVVWAWGCVDNGTFSTQKTT